MFSVVPCTTRVVLPTGAAATGTLTFTLSEAMEDTSSGEIVAPIPITVSLDGTGSMVVRLIANDDPTTITASGKPATYTVLARLVGQPDETYTVSVACADAGKMTQLSALRVA